MHKSSFKPATALVAIIVSAASVSQAQAQATGTPINPQQQAPQPQSPQAPPTQPGAPGLPTQLWGALAAGLWRVRGVVQVSVGSAIRYNSENAAETAALAECRKGGGRNCKVAG